MQYGYGADIYRSQSACLALDVLDELVPIGGTYYQRYWQVVHDSKRYRLMEVPNLDFQVHEARDMHWCAGSSCVTGSEVA